MKSSLEKPLLRGYFHEWMFFISIGACIPLIIKSTSSTELISTIIYSVGIFMMFGFSALYHRVNWRPKVLKVMRKLDHLSIFIMIAGSFTPICLLVLPKKSWVPAFINYLDYCRNRYRASSHIYKHTSFNKSIYLSCCRIYGTSLSSGHVISNGSN